MGNDQAGVSDKKAREMAERGRRSKWWRRLGSMKSGFWYQDAGGNRIDDEEGLERIKRLVIPPAWKYVRISPSKSGRLQAVGIDTTGRIQYLYHPAFVRSQERKKFAKIEDFGRHLPKLRAKTNEDMALEGFPREKVMAIMMRLINSLYFRVGTEKSVEKHKTYGITTFHNKHLTIGEKGELTFEFVGKSHIKHRKILVDEELAELMKDLKKLGKVGKLFHYIGDNGKPKAVTPADLNRYIKEAIDADFTAKDFRTWGGTLLAATELAEIGCTDIEKEIQTNIVAAVKRVAEQLGNTPAVCRASYIHPLVIESYCKGTSIAEFQPRRSRRITRIEHDFEPEERALLKLLENGTGK
ncbi:MAG: DNA topoisomerase IB [Blastocatellia bacterium]|nr:DNA topoisomerase IB [Blastocatellia bacterium]